MSIQPSSSDSLPVEYPRRSPTEQSSAGKNIPDGVLYRYSFLDLVLWLSSVEFEV